MAFEKAGHPFADQQEVFGITAATHCDRSKWQEEGGFRARSAKTRRGKIEPEQLPRAIEEKPDVYLRELAGKFHYALQSIGYRLRKLKISRKKDVHVF
ncbi:MAG: transposase [Acidaminococcales bacterium]|nr:transposase [Acidaminococcales bacterium]